MKNVPTLIRWLGVALVLGWVAVVSGQVASAQKPGQEPSEQKTGFLQRVYKDDEGQHKYALFVPQNYTPDKKWPVILFLHGAGERGSDGQQQTQIGLGPFVKARQETFPFLVVFPQAKIREKTRLLEGWAADSPDAKLAIKILDDVERQYRVDTSRRILTGWSMGGYGTWSLAIARPDDFSAIVPISGGGDSAQVARIRNLPVWAFHGAQDRVVPPEQSRKMVEALKAAGGKPRYTEVPDAGHDVWKVVYNLDALYDWMLNPTTEQPSQAVLRAKPGQRPPTGPDFETPFRPAVEVANAVVLRLGNDALREVGRSIPFVMSEDVVSGRVDDIYDSTVTEGRYFQVHFSGIRYRGALARAYVQAVGTDRLRIQLGLQNVTLTIGRTDVQGERRYAVAGPIDVVIGYRQPVWLTLEVTPFVNDGKLRLKLLEPMFDIPDDNWYVTSPAGVSAEGLGMTSERVSSGLVSGLYGSKDRIEREVLSAAPELVRRAEDGLQQPFSPSPSTAGTETGKQSPLSVGEAREGEGLVNSFWPLPVYRPRIRVWPQSVTTDDGGVTLVMGLTAAAVDPENAPKSPRRVELAVAQAGGQPTTPHLDVGVTANLLQPLSELLIDADVARVNVLDIPEKTFAPFADRDALQAAVPDLARFPDDVEIWSELILARPLSVADNAKTPTLQIPKLLISLAVRPAQIGGKPSEWTPYAEFEFSVSQGAAVKVGRPSFRSRTLEMEWSGEPEIQVSGRFAPGYKPENKQMELNKVREMFAQSWKRWTTGSPVARPEVPDVDLGYSKLRLASANWLSPHLFLTFAEPGIKLTNRSEAPLVYETKGPFSDWSEPYTLSPGKSDEFPIAYPMLFRRRVGDEYRVFTLPAGSHSEFRVPKAGGTPQLFQAREEPDKG